MPAWRYPTGTPRSGHRTIASAASASARVPTAPTREPATATTTSSGTSRRARARRTGSRPRCRPAHGDVGSVRGPTVHRAPGVRRPAAAGRGRARDRVDRSNPDIYYPDYEALGWGRVGGARDDAARRAAARPGPARRQAGRVPRRARRLPRQAPAGAEPRRDPRSVQGPRGRLPPGPARRPTITVLDVVEAIDGDEPAFRCTEIRRRGPTAQPASAYRLGVRHPPGDGRRRRRVAGRRCGR